MSDELNIYTTITMVVISPFSYLPTHINGKWKFKSSPIFRQYQLDGMCICYINTAPMLNVQDSSKYMKFFKNKVVACEQRVISTTQTNVPCDVLFCINEDHIFQIAVQILDEFRTKNYKNVQFTRIFLHNTHMQ